MVRLLFADERGVVYDHPNLLAAVRSGGDILRPTERPTPLPSCATVCLLPGRLPVGFDPVSGSMSVLEEAKVGRRSFAPQAVAVSLPPGYTRTFLPASALPTPATAPALPQWAYAAAGLGPRGMVAWALRTDRRRHWDPARRPVSEIPPRVESVLARNANPVYRQLARCATEWNCFTAQNTFLERDEGAIPSSAACNARCLGCLSEAGPGMPPSSHERILHAPNAEAMAEVGARHLKKARGRAMVSFGQGCEGEPLLRFKEIGRAIRLIRELTSRGSINLNTNGSLPRALAELAEAGLDAVRISLNGASPDLYRAYYKPLHYAFDDVVESMRVAKRQGLYLALNLLVFPGVTDRREEIRRLCRLVRAVGVDQVQVRSLAMDPDLYWGAVRESGGGGDAVGVRALVRALRQARPGIVIGNFARGMGERGTRA